VRLDLEGGVTQNNQNSKFTEIIDNNKNISKINQDKHDDKNDTSLKSNSHTPPKSSFMTSATQNQSGPAGVNSTNITKYINQS
jgi:hypothetical protein